MKVVHSRIKSNNRHQIVFSFFRSLLKGLFLRRYGFSYDDLSNIKGPYLLLANHNTNFDPILVGIMSKKQIYYVASEHITHNKPAYKALKFLFDPIVHQKGKQGIKTVKQMIELFKAGHSVCLFPEGNRSFDGRTMHIPSSVAKLIRSYKVDVVTVKLIGGYFSQPRWSIKRRKGKITGKLVNIYKKEQLKEMSTGEIDKAINSDLFEDAYETQKANPVEYRCKEPARGIESALFLCPACKSIGTMNSTSNMLTCNCGFNANYMHTEELDCSDGKIRTITEWNDFQRGFLEELVIKSQDKFLLFSDNVNIFEFDDNHRIKKKTNTQIFAYKNGCKVSGRYINKSDIEGLAIHSRNTIIAYLKGDGTHYEITGDVSFNALKYMYLYNMKE